jgi:2-dehydropantoate 2-reductase
MKIVVFGAGGVGSFYGALLARAGHDVQLVARGTQLDAINARGIRIDSKLIGQIHVPSVAATDRADDAGRADLVLVCVKAHQTSAILEDLSAVVARDTVIVPLQNGVESDEVLAARFGQDRVIAAVVYVGATVETPGVVSHVANGLIVIGARSGFDASRLPAIRDALASTGLPVRISDDIQADRWQKLIWNASFNPVSALAAREPRDLLAVPDTRTLLVGLMREVVSVARALGFALGEAHIDQQLSWTQATPAIRTSMQVDRERGRTMETEALVGAVIRAGREHGVPTPLSEVLYALLTAIDRAREST